MITPRDCDLWAELGFLRGAPSATRTRDLLLRRQLLYPLSYRGQPGQGDNLLAAAKPNRSAAVPRRRNARCGTAPRPFGHLRCWSSC